MPETNIKTVTKGDIEDSIVEITSIVEVYQGVPQFYKVVKHLIEVQLELDYQRNKML